MVSQWVTLWAHISEAGGFSSDFICVEFLCSLQAHGCLPGHPVSSYNLHALCFVYWYFELLLVCSVMDCHPVQEVQCAVVKCLWKIELKNRLE